MTAKNEKSNKGITLAGLVKKSWQNVVAELPLQGTSVSLQTMMQGIQAAMIKEISKVIDQYEIEVHAKINFKKKSKSQKSK